MSRLMPQELLTLNMLLEEISSEPPVFVDGGGGHGEWTEEVLKRWPGAIVYLFEPHPMSFAVCKEKFSMNTNVHLVRAALAEKHSPAVPFFYDPDLYAFGSSLHQRPHHVKSPLHVRAMMLADLHPTPVDVVKLDLEGGELNALRGIGDLRPAFIQFEFGEPWRDAGAVYEEAHRLLTAMGYDFPSQGDEWRPEGWEFVNVVARRVR